MAKKIAEEVEPVATAPRIVINALGICPGCNEPVIAAEKRHTYYPPSLYVHDGCTHSAEEKP